MVVQEVCKKCQCIEWIKRSDSKEVCRSCGSIRCSHNKWFLSCEHHEIDRIDGVQYFVGDLVEHCVIEALNNIEVRSRQYINRLVREIDEYKTENVLEFFTYLYSKIDNKYHIRYPGATRGYVQVDDKDIIIDIVIYDYDSPYKKEVKDILKKYIGMKIVNVKKKEK